MERSRRVDPSMSLNRRVTVPVGRIASNVDRDDAFGQLRKFFLVNTSYRACDEPVLRARRQLAPSKRLDPDQ